MSSGRPVYGPSMAEQPEDLHETLARLHDELEAASDLGEESRRRLRTALAEIQTKLEEESPEDEDWSDRLRQYAEKLESSHPDLVRAIDRVARALSGVGF